MPDPAATCQVSHYENELARHFGIDHAVAVASGTAALHCALAACGVGRKLRCMGRARLPGSPECPPCVSGCRLADEIQVVSADPGSGDCRSR
ncbi:MAG: DegT/DnrJ/EryC1/StrS family aminotransferase [Streptosporangiaceae bacterium]